MKLLNFCVCLLFSILGLCSCSSENDLKELGDQNRLERSESIDVLKAYVSKYNSVQTKSNNVIQDIVLDKTYEVELFDSVNNVVDRTFVSQYLIKQDGQEGYSVVIDDLRFSSVLVYVPQGHFSDTTSVEPLKYYFRNIPSMVNILYNKYKNEKYSFGPRSWGIIGSMIPTEWHAEEPYNKNVPVSCSSLKAPAGSHTVAMAQAAARFKKGSYNWNRLLTSSIVSKSLSSDADRRTEVARLFENVGKAANTTYSCTGSNASISDVVKGLKSIGFSAAYSSPMKDYTKVLNLIRKELTANKIIIMHGTQFQNGNRNTTHYWIIDQMWIHNDNGQELTWGHQFHCNWGWVNSEHSSAGNGNQVLSNGVFTFLENMNLLTGGMMGGNDQNSFRSMTIIAGIY